MMEWTIRKKSKLGHPEQWRSSPWTIRKLFFEGHTIFELWKDYRSDPECWCQDLEDAQAMAEMIDGEQPSV